jgi:hypothetical protein
MNIYFSIVLWSERIAPWKLSWHSFSESHSTPRPTAYQTSAEQFSGCMQAMQRVKDHNYAVAYWAYRLGRTSRSTYSDRMREKFQRVSESQHLYAVRIMESKGLDRRMRSQSVCLQWCRTEVWKIDNELLILLLLKSTCIIKVLNVNVASSRLLKSTCIWIDKVTADRICVYAR